MEGQIILSTIARRVSMELLSRRPIELQPYITLRPKGGVPVRVHHAISPRMVSMTTSGASS
jgi:cytochrome P450